MKTKTIIHSNGSKWMGQKPDPISKLIEVLKKQTIREDFFETYFTKNKKYVMNPITKNSDGSVTFFGNFEEVSHVFRIETNDMSIIANLTKLIKKNNGWKKYFKK